MTGVHRVPALQWHPVVINGHLCTFHSQKKKKRLIDIGAEQKESTYGSVAKVSELCILAYLEPLDVDTAMRRTSRRPFNFPFKV
jgi:hypothetical protein